MRSLGPTLLAVIAFVGFRGAAHAAPELVHRGQTIFDTLALGGDNDRRPEPGESFDFALRLGNEGDDDASNITATLTSSDPLVIVQATPASVGFPNVAVGAFTSNTAPHFRVAVDPSVPCGTPVTFSLSLNYTDSMSTPLSDVVRFVLFMGEVTILASEDFDQGPSGWNQDPTASTALAGAWVNAAPQAYQVGGMLAQPGRDVSYPDVSCFFTGQNLTMTSVENVDGGRQVLRSLDYDLSGQSRVYLVYHRFFFSNDTGAADSWEMQVSNDGGTVWTRVERITASANRWTQVAFLLDPLVPLTNRMRFRVLVEDVGAASVCEGAIDELQLITVGCAVDPQEAALSSAFATIDDSIDPVCTDNDGIADAGETFDFTVRVENNGTATANNVAANLVAIPPGFTLLSADPVALGSLADNGGATTATWTLLVDTAMSCQTPYVLEVDLRADPVFTATRSTTNLIAEEDVNQPLRTWFDDFDSALPPWSVVLYGTFNDWAPGLENCAQNPGTPPTPARNFWYTGDTGVPTDCTVTPYGPLDDSSIRSPRIDTGYTRPLLRYLRWNHLLTMGLDADAAEIWIDHDDDMVFDLIARFQGQVTTNGDTLDPAEVDLQNNPMMVDLSNASQFVQFEMRFKSDGTGGGSGPPLALGWIVDNVELEWTDSDGRACDANSCTGCLSSATLAPAPPASCVGVPVDLDASGSIVSGCPAPGVITYQWYRDGAPIAAATMSTYRADEATPASYTYTVEVGCSTDATCLDTIDHVIDFRPNGALVAVGNTVRGVKRTADVELTWMDAQTFVVGWRMYRSQLKSDPGTPLPDVLLPIYVDGGAISPPPDRYFYNVRALNCAGMEGP